MILKITILHFSSSDFVVKLKSDFARFLRIFSKLNNFFPEHYLILKFLKQFYKFSIWLAEGRPDEFKYAQL